jgi:cytochrome c oxidase subunit II
MTTLIILLSAVLVAVIAVQVGRLTEITAAMREAAEVQGDRNKLHAVLGLGFVVIFLVACCVSAWYYKNDMMGFAGNIPVSEHGHYIDNLFYITLVPTGIIFILCHLALFWFAYKYKGEVGRKVLYMPHDNKLEFIWTAIPAFVMALLVVGGLWTWNKVMADIPADAKPGKDYIEIEATGYQFAWVLRYPGADNLLGKKDFRLIDEANNNIGQDWTDAKNHDDFKPDDIVLPVNKTVRVRITSRDVLHNFCLSQFRLKMDAVPGMPTYFVFKPIVTTEERRQQLKKLPEWQELKDGKPRWATFDYELNCAEMCGQGHFSMRKVVRIVTEPEYQKWLGEQKSYYISSVQGKEWDTYGKDTKPATTENHKGEGTDNTKPEGKPISMTTVK